MDNWTSHLEYYDEDVDYHPMLTEEEELEWINFLLREYAREEDVTTD